MSKKCIVDDILFQTGLYLGLKVGQANPKRDLDGLKFQVEQIVKEYYENNEWSDLDSFFSYVANRQEEST